MATATFVLPEAILRGADGADSLYSFMSRTGRNSNGGEVSELRQSRWKAAIGSSHAIKIAMNTREIRIRFLFETVFFLCLFAAFLWEASGNYFCIESGRGVMVRQSLNLALIVSVWDSVAVGLAFSVGQTMRASRSVMAARFPVGGGIAAVGYFAAVYVLAPGEQVGVFRSSLDSSCFFTEGYGMMFPIIWAPILVIASTLRELATQLTLRRVKVQ